MKKIVFLLILSCFITNLSFASKFVNTRMLRTATSNTLISNYPIASGVTVTSDTIKQGNNEGFASLKLDVSGSVTTSVEVSLNGTNWYTPYTTDGSSLTSAGQIVSAQTADRWIIYTAKLAPYLRYVFVAGSNSTITAQHIHQEDN